MALLGYVDRFGAQAVFGRAMGAGEIRRLTVVDNILQAYRMRSHTENWAEWAESHKRASAMLNEAAKLAEDTDNGE